MMSISLADFVDSIAGDRIAELEAEVEELKSQLTRKTRQLELAYEEGYDHGTRLGRKWSSAELLVELDAVEPAKAEGESDGRS